MRSVYIAKRYLGIFVPFACILELLAFNLDLKEPKVYGNGHAGEYFGYAVALDSYGSGETFMSLKWPLLVGAPLGNKSSNILERNRHGSLFRCSTDTSKTCEIVEVDPAAPETVDFQGDKYDVEFKIGQMLGATIESKNGKYVVCAPRFTRVKEPTSRNKGPHRKRFPVGRCFYYVDGNKRETFSPCGYNSRYDSSSPATQTCEAGFSAGLSKDGSMVSMGLPGYRGTLSIAFAQENDNRYPLANTGVLDLAFGDMMGYAMTVGFFKSESEEDIVSSSPRSDNFKGKVVIFSITNSDEIAVDLQSVYPKESDEIQEGSYFGSSLCAVDLNNDGWSDLLVGAPTHTVRRDEGRVYVYMNKNGVLNLNKDMILKGDNKQDARFGFSIAAAGDLNLDGFEDVVIGAPYEDGVGAVYVYFGSANGIHSSPRARQKIVGAKYSARMKSFGFSVAGAVDADGNGYPDIAVGAVQSDQAMLIRTRPIIVVNGVVKLNTRQIVLENNDEMCAAKDKTMHKCIEVRVCFSFRTKREKAAVTSDVDVSYSVDLDKNIVFKRLFIESANGTGRQVSYKANFTLGKAAGVEKCDTKRTVLLQQPKQIGDLVNPLTFDLTYDLNNPPSCSPNLCPVLDVLSGDSYREEARFLRHCKNQQVCHPDLEVTGNVTFRKGNSFYNKIFVGLVDTMFVNLKVRNNDDDAAYSSEVVITFPSALSYIGPGNQDVKCETRKIKEPTLQQAVCKVGNPLRGKNQKAFFIEFATVGIQGNLSNFDLVVEAGSASNESDYGKHQNNRIVLPVDVANEADMYLEGSSEPDQVIYRDSATKIITWINQIGVQVLQKVIVKNDGPSSVDEATVNISVPVRYDADDPKSHLLYLTQVKVRGGTCIVKTNPLNLKEGGNATVPVVQESKSTPSTRSGGVTEVNCKTDPSLCLTFTCKIGQFGQEQSTVIEMYSRFWQGTLYKVGAGPVDLVTFATVSSPLGISEPTKGKANEIQIVMRANPATVTTPSKSIQWWIILLAVLAALILLAGVIFIMYKKGFFQRKKPPSKENPDKDDPVSKEETVPMREPFPADC